MKISEKKDDRKDSSDFVPTLPIAHLPLLDPPTNHPSQLPTGLRPNLCIPTSADPDAVPNLFSPLRVDLPLKTHPPHVESTSFLGVHKA